MAKLYTTVVIDVPRRIRYGNRALYRHGTLDKPLGLEEFRKPQKRVAVLAQWLWACLADEDQNAFATPDDLAEAIEGKDVVELVTALNDAIALAQPKTPKNGDSSTSSPSPASSSA